MTNTDLLTPRETAAYLKVSERTLIRMRNARKGPAWTYAAGLIRYRRADLEQYLENRRVEPVREGAA